MQLPTSVTAPNYNPPSSSRPSQTSSSSRTTQENTQEVETKEAPSQPQETAKTQEARSSAEAFAPVEQPTQSELPNQDLTSRPNSDANTGNPGTDRYQQIAREEATNAQAQDPSLFRVDVYV